MQHPVPGVTRERMLRELAEALEALSAERPVVLVLEDLHWSDTSTVEALALLARRRDPARLLVLGTYRPVELIVHDHPLKTVKQELVAHGQCVEVPLGYLRPGGGGRLSGAPGRGAGGARRRGSVRISAHRGTPLVYGPGGGLSGAAGRPPGRGGGRCWGTRLLGRCRRGSSN